MLYTSTHHYRYYSHHHFPSFCFTPRRAPAGAAAVDSRVLDDIGAPVEQIDDEEEQREYNARDFVDLRHRVHLLDVPRAVDPGVLLRVLWRRLGRRLGRRRFSQRTAAAVVLQLDAYLLPARRQLHVDAVDFAPLSLLSDSPSY